MRENRGGVKFGVVWMSAIVLAVGVLFTSIAGRAQAPQAGDPLADWRQSKIVFDSLRDGNYEIYVMNADGSNQQRLTNWERGDQFPAWSPDSKRIAFTSWGREEGLRAAIFTMGPDGSNVTRLSKSIGKQNAPRFPGDRALSPKWSPDGRRILFESDRDENVSDIFVMDVDGSNIQRLTITPGPGKFSSDTAWSPDGKWIAFDSNRNGNTEIYVMSADGSNQKRLTDTPGTAANRQSYKPQWSPDGKRFVFGSTRDRTADNDNWVEIVELYTMDTVDARSGTMEWQDQTSVPPGYRDFATAVALNGKAVYVAGSSGRDFVYSEMLVRGYDAVAGTLLWDDRSHRSSTATTAVDVALGKNRLFVAGYTSEVGTDFVIRAYGVRNDGTASQLESVSR